MAELISSKVVVREAPPRIRQIFGLSTAEAAMQGVTEKGPFTVQTITTFDEWVDLYGGFIAASKMAAIVEKSFQQGVQTLHFRRVVHLNSQLDAATKTSKAGTVTLSTPAVAATFGTVLGTRSAPFLLTPGDTLDLSVDAAAVDTATFDATAGAVTSTGTKPFGLAASDDLKIKVDGGVEQTVTFVVADFANIAAATAQEVVDVINRDTFGLTASVSSGAVVLTTDRQGTSSSIEVTGGVAAGVTKLNIASGVNSGTGDVAFIDAVTVAEIKTVVEADITPAVTVTDVNGRVQIATDTSGTGGSIEVKITSTADQSIGLDNLVHTGTDAGTFTTLRVDGKYEGAYANALRARITDATSGVAGEFNLTLLRNGAVVQVFPNLTMDDTAITYVEKIVNSRSTNINVVDLDAATTAALQRPKNGNFALSGGDDGLTGLVDADYIGSSAGTTGHFAFDGTEGIRVIADPDRPTAPVQSALAEYAEFTRENSMFAVITLPEGSSRDAAITFVRDTANLKGKTEVAAVYWPDLTILNPDRTAFGDTDTITIPNSGHIVGLYARVDGNRDGGVYDEPAGLERGILVGVQGLADEKVNEERTRDLIVQQHINPIRTKPGAPFFVDDELVLKRNGNFPTVAQRRGVTFIEQSIKDGLDVFRHRANDPRTRSEVDDTLNAFLLVQFKNGAFRGETPAESYFTDVGTKLNSALVIAQEKLKARIGVATQRPMRFIELEFSQDLRDVAAELAAAT